ncbi:MAG TPA: nucleotide sugar dehydrogenase, partial [Candidatus Eisenbacteria bacterium]|nr:nucleotide sugar dehydrogenase [Candidatus Eisenbacteria bacterium]
LLENTFRSVNIALIFELATLCHRMNINIWEVIDAAATKPFGFMPFYPGPGLGGHCIPIDPFYLSWKAKQSGFDARFIELAGAINGDMPGYVVVRVSEALNERKKCLNGSKILIMGVSYKKDIDDTRESPAFDIIRLLNRMGADVYWNDPFVEKLEVENGSATFLEYEAGNIREMDCAIVVTGHTAVDYSVLVENCQMVFDSRNVLKKFDSDRIVRM